MISNNITIKTLNNKIEQNQKLINQYSNEQERNIDTIHKMSDMVDQLKDEIKDLENEIEYINNKPSKDQQIQWKILDGN